MKINNYSDIIQYCHDWLKDDYTELWVLVKKIKQENEELTFGELIEATKEVIRDLVLNYNIRLVDPDTEEPTEDTHETITNMIETLMLKLGRLPTIGDGIWLTA